MAIITNLYPPIVQQTAPAFVRTQNCKIYFSLSNYSSINDIKMDAVQISLINQRTNASAFRTDLYPSGIKITTMFQDKDNSKGDYKYYIIINTDDLIAINEIRAFALNQFYKVQLRFTSAKVPTNPPSDGKGLATWLYDNQAYFSEWSKICLIKGIEQPIISIHNFDTVDENQQMLLTNSTIQLVGKMTFSNSAETEYLKSYNVKIYQTNNKNNILVDSGEIYTNPRNPNEFNYQVTQDLFEGVGYTMVFTYTTNNLYIGQKEYKFSIIQYGIDKLNADIIATADEENGKIKIDIIGKNNEIFIGNLTIRRTSSKSGFHKWEDVNTTTYKTGTQLNYTWYDSTIESGIWYKYCAQKRNSYGSRGAIIQIEQPVMCLLDDIFLTRDNCQLKIKLNPSLSEFKYNVTESQQVTIGSKYPYITRNGNNYFRSFPIGGLISSFIDTTDWYDPHFYDGEFHYDENEIKAFTSKDEIYGETKQLYQDYNDKKNIDQYNDFIYERKFREKVYDFLYQHNVKLFRSTTEGNILIKLMNIDFQPVESLGRRLYSFTATAVEVDEANIANYSKYGIQEIGDYESYIVYTHDVLGQIKGTFYSSDGNLLTSKINPKYSKLANKGFKNQINNLKWLKIEITSAPYAISDKNGKLTKISRYSTVDPQKTMVGYIVIINGIEMIIPSTLDRQPYYYYPPANANAYPSCEISHVGFFELKQENTSITDLRFKYGTTATIDFIANLNEIEDTSNYIDRIYYYKKVGQLYGTFQPEDSLIRKIYDKYFIKANKYYQKLSNITDIKVEGPPGAVVYVKDSKDITLNRHVLENGFLQFMDDQINIEGLYFCGLHLVECKNPLETRIVNGITEEDFVLQSTIYEDFNDLVTRVKSPKNGGIYQTRGYGFKDGAFLQNHKLLVVDEDKTSYREVTPDNLYTLIMQPIEDDDKLKFVYYYGCWYLLDESYEKTKLFDDDIRYLRDNEYILTDEHYDSVEDIENPIPNGVYYIASMVVDDDQADLSEQGLLKVSGSSAIKIADKEYALIVQQLYEEANNRYIYYHGGWYLFTIDHDVLYPVDGIVDYYCEVEKGEYYDA